MDKVRNFPNGTCPCSRHTAMIAQNLTKHGKDFIVETEPRHAAISLAVTVEQLWVARAKLQELGYDNKDGKVWVKV